MQDLRDQLLKAGLVDKKTARKAKTSKRKKRRKAGGQKAVEVELAAKEAAFAAKKRAEAAAARQRQAELNAAKAAEAEVAQVRDMVRRQAVVKFLGRDRPFFFVGPDRKVRKLVTSFEIGDLLAKGRLAVVLVDDDPLRDYAVVERAAAERLLEVDPGRILFWNKPGRGTGDLPAFGSGDKADATL